jgi:hypothetical protein
MKVQWIAPLVAAAALAAAGSVRAEMFKCLQPGGGVSFQQMECADPQPQPPAPAVVQSIQQPEFKKPAAQPAAPAAKVAAPATATAPAAKTRAAAAPAVDPTVIPTKRKREVLEISAQLERCRRDMPDFAQKSEAVYQAWKVRHAATLAEHHKLLVAKVRAARHGEMSLPLAMCSEEWLAKVEPLSRMPDTRFATVEKTWQVFMGALMTGDRATALSCFAGKAEARWKEKSEKLSNEDLRRIAGSIRALKVQWGDDYEREGMVADTENRAVGIAFRNVNEEWKITEMGGATPAPVEAKPVVTALPPMAPLATPAAAPLAATPASASQP